MHIASKLRLRSSTQSSHVPLEQHGSATQSTAGSILSLPNYGLSSLLLSRGRGEDWLAHISLARDKSPNQSVASDNRLAVVL